jgi:hypothetical protein
MPAPLPLAPRPYGGEATSSWVKRVAARYDMGLDVEGARVFGVRLTPSLTSWIANLRSDVLATFRRSVFDRPWGLVSSANRLSDVMRELAVCIILATGTKSIPRIGLPEPQAGQAVSPSLS